jgi:hypothetical protein
MKIEITRKEHKLLCSLLSATYHREVVEDKYKNTPQWTIFGKLIEAEKEVKGGN